MSGEACLHAVSHLDTQFEPLTKLILNPPLVNVGRALSNDYVIPHISISRQHCSFKRTDNDEWVINDKSSTGILINNQPIPKSIDHPLKNNDTIQLDFNGSFVYNFINEIEICDNKPVSSCTHSDIINWIQNPECESNLFQNQDLSNVASQLQNFEEKRVAVVNQKSVLQSKHVEDLRLLESNYQDQIKRLKGDSEVIKQQKEELLLKVERDKEELEFKFKNTTDSLEKKIQKYESQVEVLMEENRTLIENFNNERKAYEKQIQEITNISEKKVEDLERKLDDKDSHFNKEKEIMEKKMIEDAKILKNNMELISEYKNKCIALEAEKKETEEKLNKDKDQLSNKIAEIEMNMEDSVSRKRKREESESNSANYGDLLESELVCTICMEYFINAVTLGCTHTFCKHCITQWKKRSLECPFCRVRITSETECRVIDSVVDKIVKSLDEDLRKKRQELIDERKNKPIPKKNHRQKNRPSNSTQNVHGNYECDDFFGIAYGFVRRLSRFNSDSSSDTSSNSESDGSSSSESEHSTDSSTSQE